MVTKGHQTEMKAQPTIKTARRQLPFSVNLIQVRKWFAEADTETAAESAETTATKTDAKGADDIQKRMDALAGNVRKEATEKATAAERNRILEALGGDPKDEKSMEALKALISAGREAEEAKLSAEQKANKRIAELEKERDDAIANATAAEQKRKDSQLNTRLETLAGKAGAQFPDDIVDYARRNYADKVTALMDDTGKIDDKKVEALVGEIKTARPNFFDTRRGAGSGSHGGGRSDNNDPAAEKAATAKLRAQIRNTF